MAHLASNMLGDPVAGVHDEKQPAPAGPQAAQPPSQYVGSGDPANAAPAPAGARWWGDAR